MVNNLADLAAMALDIGVKITTSGSSGVLSAKGTYVRDRGRRVRPARASFGGKRLQWATHDLLEGLRSQLQHQGIVVRKDVF